MSKNNVVNLGLNVKGETRYKLIDTRTGKVDEESDWKDNLLLYGYLNGFFTKDRPLLENDLFDKLYLGDSDIAPDRSQTGLQGSQLGVKTKDSIIESFNYDGKKPYDNPILNYTGHSSYVYSVAFSSDDTMVVSGSSDDTAKVWNVSDGSLVTEYTGHSSSVNSVAFSSDDTMVVSGSSDDTAKVLEKYTEITSRSMTAKWIFEPGEGTGNIKEVFIDSYDYGDWDNDPIARQIYSDAINKEDYHRLEFEWRITVNRGTGSYTGTITTGGRDGITDINYEINIGNMSFIGLTADASQTSLFGNGDVVKVSGGDSNQATDMIIDILVFGNSNGKITPYEVSPDPYTADSLERTYRIGFDTTHLNLTNGVGELVFKDSNNNPQFRMTFNPKLDKVDTYRLYLDFKFSLTPA